MKHLLFLLLAVFLFFSITTPAENDSPFVRTPSLNSDGSKIAFSFQGDIWVMPASGGTATRMTVHEGYEVNPRWSFDGKAIAFEGNRLGNNDIFTIPSEGGVPKRLTFHSSNDFIGGWTPDNKIVFTAKRDFNQIEWTDEFYEVSATGGTPTRILDAFGNAPSVSPDNKFIVFTRGEGDIERETYTGAANKNIWLYNKSKKTYKQLTTSNAQDICPVWGNSKTIFYLSAKSGRYNIYKLEIDEDGNAAGESQLTNYKDDGVRFCQSSADGSTLVFERQADIYIMKTNGGSPQKINISVAADYKLDPYEFKTLSAGVTDYSVSPNGKYSAFVSRGEVFVKENDKEKSKSVNLSNHPYRDHQVSWLSDSSLVFVSDRNGQFDLYLVRSSDKNQTNIFKSLKHEIIRLTDTDVDEFSPTVSPDGKKIAFQRLKGNLYVADISAEGKLSNEKTLAEGWSPHENLSWSPDSKWLAYSIEDLYTNAEVFIRAADGSKEPVNISMHPRGDVNPVWSPDGKKLGFISNRNNNNNDVWFVWLNKKDWEKQNRTGKKKTKTQIKRKTKKIKTVPELSRF